MADCIETGWISSEGVVILQIVNVSRISLGQVRLSRNLNPRWPQDAAGG